MKVRLSFGFLVCATACGTSATGEPQPEYRDVSPTQPRTDDPLDASVSETKIPGIPDATTDALVDGNATCFDKLTARGIGYKKTIARGVVDAVNVTDPLINGVGFNATTTTAPLSDPIACEFVLTLYDFAAVLKKRGVASVGSLGSYCYRCCCAWSETNFCRGLNDPEPDCSKDGYSTHSWGRAIDIRYVKFADGSSADINTTTDWMKATDDTCGAALAKQTGMSAKLYSIVCEAASLNLFGDMLTPNYNSAHRNHWHLDTGKSAQAGSTFVKSWNDELVMSRLARVDVGDAAGSCGDE
jgi:hypothetical protein